MAATGSAALRVLPAHLAAITLSGLLANGKPAKDARAYLNIGPSTRISPVVTTPGDRPRARSEITIGPLTTFARETPEEVVRAPCVERVVGPPD